MKLCANCGESKPLDAFSFRKDSGEYRVACKTCRAVEQKARRIEDPERQREIERQRHAKHHEKRKATMRAAHHADRERRNAARKAWYAANREHSLQLMRDWYAANRGRARAYKANYEVMKRQAIPPWADRDAIAKVYKLAEFVRSITGAEYHVDHIIPLRGERVCGLHVHTNLRVVPAEENMAKHNTFDETLLDAAD